VIRQGRNTGIPIENLNTKQIRIYGKIYENGKSELLKSARLRGEK
jgi:hypothetical protein